MTQRDNILQELNELGSSLANGSFQSPYTVPSEYFEGLLVQVLSRIKALEAKNAAEELSCLSPFLSEFSKEMPNHVPAGYFENFPGKMIQVVQANSGYQSAKEELETLSPFLSSLKKEMPYSVPEGYFDGLQAKKKASVVSITSHKWFRYTAAAIVIGVVATTALLINNNPDRSLAIYERKLEKEIKKASDQELTEFAELTSASKDVAFNDNKDELKELLKDVPESELQQFIDEIADPEIIANTSAME